MDRMVFATTGHTSGVPQRGSVGFAVGHRCSAAGGLHQLGCVSSNPFNAANCTNRVISVLSRAESPKFESLIPQTLEELESDEELQELHEKILQVGQAALSKEEDEMRKKSLSKLGLPGFKAMCESQNVSPLKRGPAKTLQLNIGLYCNQACRHCHVESSPKRTEMMRHDVASRCVELMDGSPSIEVVDLTGGAPELCPAFRYLVSEARKRGLEVIDRCNLTVLMEPGQEDLASFLAEHGVRVVASMPCYSKSNVDSQRGGGVFDRSIKGLKVRRWPSVIVFCAVT